MNIYENKLRDNLIKLMRRCRVKVSELHKTTGVPLTTLKRMKNDVNSNPTLSSIIPVANFFGLTIDQLVGIVPLPSDKLLGTYQEKRGYWINVPIIQWEEVIDWPQININTYSVISTDAEIARESFALIIETSDLTGFLANSILIIDPQAKPEHGDYIIAIKEGEKTTSLKQLLVHEGEAYLKPVNPHYKTVSLDMSYKILGLVVQVKWNIERFKQQEEVVTL
jgi:SOS-response transcriptional repressor LexA